MAIEQGSYMKSMVSIFFELYCTTAEIKYGVGDGKYQFLFFSPESLYFIVEKDSLQEQSSCFCC